jgi:hypothetical protein
MAIANIFSNSVNKGEGFSDNQPNKIHCRLLLVDQVISGTTLLTTYAPNTDITLYSDEFKMRNNTNSDRVYIPEDGYYLIHINLALTNGSAGTVHFILQYFVNTNGIGYENYYIGAGYTENKAATLILYLREKNYFCSNIYDYGAGNCEIAGSSTISVTKLMVGSI